MMLINIGSGKYVLDGNCRAALMRWNAGMRCLVLVGPTDWAHWNLSSSGTALALG